MASITFQPRPEASRSIGKAEATNVTMERGSRAKPTVIVVILIAAFFLLQSQIPLQTSVQIGADEGFELAKATLCLHGHKLYSEVWNDQPPLHTFLVTQAIKHATSPILVARLLTTAFSAVLLGCVFTIIRHTSGLLIGLLATALLIASPGFLELSSSCMLEIPALAAALAGISILLVLPRTKWGAAECLAGILFGMAALMKLVPLYLIPLAALIFWPQRDEFATGLGVSTLRAPRRLEKATQMSEPFALHTLPAAFESLRSLTVPLLTFGASLVASFCLIDWLIERGAYLSHFQQSWASHFGGTKSFEYGSPAEHQFDWSILFKNWDATVPAVLGIVFLVSRLPKSRYVILPLAWLGLALIVFTNHKPWWSYYYIHIAIPLCWCAAVGIEAVYAAIARRFANSEQSKKKQGKVPSLQVLGGGASVILFGLIATGWMGARVYLQIVGIRSSPQLHSALVLQEIERLKPFSKWMYTDQLVHSFHANIPMPPPLAVVPLKRLWNGDMTNDRITAEITSFKPEIILLRNDNRPMPFHELLNSEYRLIYQDVGQRLYATPTVIKRARSLEMQDDAVSFQSSHPLRIQKM